MESPKRKSPIRSRKESSGNKEHTNSDLGNNDPRTMAEYQTALELEMWKQQQEEMFTAQVRFVSICSPNQSSEQAPYISEMVCLIFSLD